MDANATGPTAVELFWTVPQPDAAGERTADLFDWQAAMATADGLSLYETALNDDGSLAADHYCRVVCELHEDWAVAVDDDVELVSAKHRDAPYGAYTTVNQLANDGGIAHLFNRWHALGEKPTCRLVTTPGLADAAQDLATAIGHLRTLRLSHRPLTLNEEHEKPIKDLCKYIRQHTSVDRLPESWTQNSNPKEPTAKERDQVARFLSMLTLDHTRLPRGFVAYAAANMYAKPVLERLGAQAEAEAVWQAVHDLMRVRMRAAGPMPRGGLPLVLAYKPETPLPSAADLERADVGRIITMPDIDFAVRMAIANPQGFRPLAPQPRLTRLSVKMKAGQCGEISIERAEELHRDYRDYWRHRMSGDPTARAEQAKLRRRLYRLSDEAAEKFPVIRGKELWRELQRRIDDFPEDALPVGMDADLLLGGVCDLTRECKVWFSKSFDVDAEIERLRSLQQGAS
ncbi:hypothetical protein OHT59_44330 [Streptomyces sp. NBC_00243]|uniref:hypothetical protein n=1 Tax=Streptomyces sp. NBC_00243 TaxID=2975688 RepID=UPI002DDC5CF6|nr:hypothetical protein [Streptomyces sp. NBC_00243]WRZ25061.1 hypothetical protein OHT59_44330 [Streptomyces sp. NBC_00243]